MSTKRRFRAFRFVHPDFDAPDMSSGLRASVTGNVEMVEGDASVRQALLLLLTTRPGERVMNPTYGCDLNQILFAPNDDTTAGLAIHYVRQAIARWEPRVDIIDLDAGRNPDDASRLEIHLAYRVRPTLSEERLSLRLQLMEPPI